MVKQSLLKNTIIKLFKQGHSRNLKTLLEKIHPADLALILPSMDAESKKALFEYYVTDKQAAKIISRLRDKKNISEVLGGLRRHRISEIFKHIEPDDIAYILSITPVKEAESLLRLMKKDDAEEANKVLRFTQDTAGGMMNTLFISVDTDVTLEQCIKELKRSKEKNELHCIYIIDPEGALKGKLQIKDLFRWASDTKVLEIMDDNPVYLSWDTPHSEVTEAASKYGIPEIPVVDRGRRLIGVISAEHIFKAQRQEAASRILRMGALINIKEPNKANLMNSIKIKIPLMIYAIVAGLMATAGIDYYLLNDGIHAPAINLIPLAIITAYAISSSSASIILRELFFERINAKDTSSFKSVITEMRAAMFYGILTSLIAAAYSLYLMGTDIRTAVLCFAGLLLSTLVAAFSGSFLSVLMVRAGLRPTRIPLALVASTAIIAATIIYLWSIDILYYTNIVPDSWKTLNFL